MAHLKKGEAYYPQPGSYAEVLVTALRKARCVLTPAELSDLIGVPSSQLCSILQPARSAGMLSRPPIESGRRQGWLYVGEPAPQSEDEQEDTQPMIRRVVPAATAAPVWRADVRPPSSVFDMGRYHHDCQA